MMYRGKVVHQLVGGGSRSEHRGLVLETAQESWELLRAGGNPFVDAELEHLVGEEITCEGEVQEGHLLVTRWDVIGTGLTRAAHLSS